MRQCIAEPLENCSVQHVFTLRDEAPKMLYNDIVKETDSLTAVAFILVSSLF